MSENMNSLENQVAETPVIFNDSAVEINPPASTAASPFLVASSIIIGAIIISGSIFYSANLLLKGLNGQAISQFVGGSSGNTLAPSAPPAPSAPSAAPAGAAVNITLPPNTPYLGNAKAKVTVVEYADYECPFCERFFTDTFQDLKTKYIDTGKIKFYYQDFAFLGPDSNTAAEAAHCAADQNKFWQYHDYLFKNQGQEGSGWATADHQKQFAQAVGLNTSAFNQCLDSGKYKQQVLDETNAGKSYGVSGTPSVFVNGKIIVGAQPTASFEQAIEDALKTN